MSEARDLFETICAALAEGAEAVVEVTQHDDGSMTVEWGVSELPLLSAPPAGARAVADGMIASGWYPEIGEMLITACDFCDRGGRALN
ncbi:MAG: hypothetical protein AB1942_20045 [Pseudomonadota bacterium]